ncbi:MAG: NAD(P)-dependent alcohol dehydrogenase [Acidobacteriota bacterium]
MKAVLYRSYGEAKVLEIGTVEAPLPRRTEVLVRVAAAALNPKDILTRKGKFKLFTGRRFPMVPGLDIAGEVIAKGSAVATYDIGQRVHGMLNGWRGGGCAEQAVAGESELAPIPTEMSVVQAAALPLAGMTALQALRDLLRVKEGERVCINGASGGVGTLAVQIAKLLGAQVVAVCSGRNAALVAGLGADEVVDYTHTDVTRSGPYDAFFDVFGNCPPARVSRALPSGRHCTTVPSPGAILRELQGRLLGRPRRMVIVRGNGADLRQLDQWYAARGLDIVVDRVLPFSQAAEAHRYLETKRARGKVVLVPDPLFDHQA